MTEEQPTPAPRPRRRRRQSPSGLVSLKQRAQELGMTTASLRRYVNLGMVQGQTSRVGNRIHVGKDLVVTSPRARQHPQSSTEAVRPAPTGRSAVISRETAETNVTVEVNLDGQGQYQVQSGDPMLDHLLAQLSRHGLLDLQVSALGDGLPDNHHLVEDVAIVLGRAIRQAVGEGRGIRRMGSSLVPMDEALAQVVVDVSGRGYAVVDAKLDGAQIGSLGGELVGHFLERFAIEGGINLHVQVLRGSDPHHKAEAIFKALARALRAAVEEDPRAATQVPSTKGSISV